MDATARVREVLETDREWAAYALADLAPEFSAQAEWHVSETSSAVVLIYRGLTPPVLFALGTAAAIEPLLAQAARDDRLYLSVQADVLELVRIAGYAIEHPKVMYRMALDKSRFRPPVDGLAERLGPEDCERLLALYADGDAAGESPVFFDGSMLESGVYYGIREGGNLIAVAGTHIVAADEDAGCIGNVYTRRDRRGRGHAHTVTAAVASTLIARGIRTIALNVAANNPAAIGVYEALGFTRHCEYREAVAVHCG
jgi:ribosomal protein S18 acetylase RimI-like enzyme